MVKRKARPASVASNLDDAPPAKSTRSTSGVLKRVPKAQLKAPPKAPKAPAASKAPPRAPPKSLAAPKAIAARRKSIFQPKKKPQKAPKKAPLLGQGISWRSHLEQGPARETTGETEEREEPEDDLVAPVTAGRAANEELVALRSSPPIPFVDDDIELLLLSPLPERAPRSQAPRSPAQSVAKEIPDFCTP